MPAVLKSTLPGVLVALVVIAAAMTAGITAASSQIPTELPGTGDVTTARLSGPDRFGTSVEISQFQFPDGADTVFLARADEFADALSAGSLTGGPILLVPSCGTLPQVIEDEITRLQPTDVIALGGEAAVCEDILQQAGAAAAEEPEASEGPSPSETPTPTETPTATESPTEADPLPTLPGMEPTETETPTTAS